MRAPSFVVAPLLAATFVQPSRAEVEDVSPRDGASSELGTSTALTLSATTLLNFADPCQHGEGEMYGEPSYCSARGFVGGELGSRIQLNERWALAPFVAFAVEAGSRAIGSSTEPICPVGAICSSSTLAEYYTSQLGAVGAAAHYHPFEGGFWLGPRIGMQLLRDITDESRNGGPTERSSLYRPGAEFGAGGGYDWHLSDVFALSFSGRVAQTWFPGAEPAPLEGRTAASGPLVALGVGGWLGL